jgi:hypothetical protein
MGSPPPCAQSAQSKVKLILSEMRKTFSELRETFSEMRKGYSEMRTERSEMRLNVPELKLYGSHLIRALQIRRVADGLHAFGIAKCCGHRTAGRVEHGVVVGVHTVGPVVAGDPVPQVLDRIELR